MDMAAASCLVRAQKADAKTCALETPTWYTPAGLLMLLQLALCATCSCLLQSKLSGVQDSLKAELQTLQQVRAGWWI
jgi:hypothetical protein